MGCVENQLSCQMKMNKILQQNQFVWIPTMFERWLKQGKKTNEKPRLNDLMI